MREPRLIGSARLRLGGKAGQGVQTFGQDQPPDTAADRALATV
jgi:hypothetical protein